MTVTRYLPIVLAGLIGTASVFANSTEQAGEEQPHELHRSQYADEVSRDIKSLSAEDIDELRRGGGWGLARAAELNGVPGPRHLLDMGTEIGLSDDQRQQIQALFDEMQASAVDLGGRLIELESALNQRFASREIDADALERLIREIGETRSELRLVHLAAHLRTPGILSTEQIRHYNRLRGYEDDPCLSIPEGHDPVMWKHHNGCE